MSPSTHIVWFRRDLRVHDHPALAAATEGLGPGDRLVPLFVLDPRLLGGRFASADRTWFLLGSLEALRTALRERGSELVVRIGEPRTVVPALAREVGASGIWVSRDHAPFGRGRDRAIAEALSRDGIGWHPRRGVLIHEPDAVATATGAAFSVFSPFHRAWERLPLPSPLAAPVRLPPIAALDPGELPTLAALAARVPGLAATPMADVDRLPTPGEPAARARLDRWLARGLTDYATTRDRLDLEDGTSRLSADLHLGTLSPLEAATRAIDVGGEGPGPRRYLTELVWREFYAHVLFHRPAVRTQAFQVAFDALDWSSDADAIEAWRDGRTGYPVVDAAMRQLAATGWMHNRARMIAASFLTKHLLVDWRVGEAHFMRHLVDGDVASNNGGWQWSASTGTDPQPWFRIFNPVLQGRRHDPDGTYIRRWVPELRAVPTARIHAPWEDDATMASIDYPAPIVPHAAARARALATYDAARRTS